MDPRRRRELALELFRHVGAFGAVMASLARHARASFVVVAALGAAYAIDVLAGYGAAPAVRGTLTVPGLHAPATIRRDARFVPHIAAADARDAYYAQGFVEASDRLFQMDLIRRYAYGTLAEVLGPRALSLDETQRYYDIREIAERQWRAARGDERRALIAFADGADAAIRTQPLPVEFRMLLYRPQPWRPQDCLAVSLAVSTALADAWPDVLARDDIWRRVGASGFDASVPLSDPRYDVGASGRLAEPRHAHAAYVAVDARAPHRDHRPRAGSNAWAAAGDRTATGRALLANDPHLELMIPGLWYLVDLRAPDLHVAGAAIPGAPGVLLGHDERVAWGATNADTVAMTLREPAALSERGWVRETFRVRFGATAVERYYRTVDEFGVPEGGNGGRIALVRWRPYDRRSSPPDALRTFLALDRATGVRDALRILAGYRGTAENFVLADDRGQVAYQLAGDIPDDPSWGRYVQRGPERASPRAVPFDRLPALAPSRDGLVVSANNRMYGAGYPYRLAASFEPPYRAFRIAQLLHLRTRYDAAYFAAMQLDTVSLADREFARAFGAYSRDLRGWNGAFAPGSRTAATVHRLREGIESGEPSFYAVLRELRAGPPRREWVFALRDALDRQHVDPQAWGTTGAVRVEHPLAPLPFGMLDGPTLPGEGDEYSIHLQQDGFSQSFRAVWDVGNWNAGGIALPAGESGEPGSGHYTDQAAAWIAGRLIPLPFGERAVAAATRDRLLLLPAR